MAVRAKQATGTGKARAKAAAKKTAVKKKDLKKAGGRRTPHTDPLLDGGSTPVMGTQRKRPARKAAVAPNKTETTANRRAKAYSTGIARGGITGGKGEGKRTHSVGRRGKNPGKG